MQRSKPCPPRPPGNVTFPGLRPKAPPMPCRKGKKQSSRPLPSHRPWASNRLARFAALARVLSCVSPRVWRPQHKRAARHDPAPFLMRTARHSELWNFKAYWHLLAVALGSCALPRPEAPAPLEQFSEQGLRLLQPARLLQHGRQIVDAVQGVRMEIAQSVPTSGGAQRSSEARRRRTGSSNEGRNPPSSHKT